MIVDGLEECFLLNKAIWCFTICGIKKNKQEFCVSTGGTQGIHGRNPIEGSAGSVGSDSGIPRIYTGGTLSRDPPDPPDLKNQAVHYFNPQRVFQIFRKHLKTKI